MAEGQTQSQAKNTPLKPGSFFKRLGPKFFINLIPIAGPILGSAMVFIFREVKNDLTSPFGVLSLIIMAPICDIITFIPIVGPIISNGILMIWLFFKNSIES